MSTAYLDEYLHAAELERQAFCKELELTLRETTSLHDKVTKLQATVKVLKLDREEMVRERHELRLELLKQTYLNVKQREALAAAQEAQEPLREALTLMLKTFEGRRYTREEEDVWRQAKRTLELTK